MSSALVALTVLSLAAAPAKPPPPGSPPPRGGSSTTSPAPLTSPGGTSGTQGSTSTGSSPGTSTGSTSGTPTGLPAGVTIKPGTSMVSVVETLYKKQQFEAADVVLGLALNNPETSASDKVQLHVLEGMLRMESFQEPQARKAFTEALNRDREAKLPDFAPPATRQLFLDVKATLPLTAPSPSTTISSSSPAAKKRAAPRPEPSAFETALPWIPIAVGGLTLGTGGGFVIASRMVDGSLQDGTAQIGSPLELRGTVANGKLYQTAGYTMVGIGGAILVGGLAWKLAPEVAPMFTVNLAPTEHGVAAVVSGSLP